MTKVRDSNVEAFSHRKINSEARGHLTDVAEHPNDRLIELLLAEYKRKRGKDIEPSLKPIEILTTLVAFWQESLSKAKILHKLSVKQQ